MSTESLDSQSQSEHGSPAASPGQTNQPSTSRQASPPRDRKGGLSCAECRRSKLRCDRNVPCQACVRRGCAKLCPNGTMAATKGNKALQSHAQKLGEQVTSMSAKIKELESALAAAHLQIRSQSDSPQDGTEGKGLTGCRRRMYGVGTGSLAIDNEGLARYYGDTSASEYFSGLIPDNGVNNPCHQPDFKALNLPPEIISLFSMFPFGMRDRSYGISVFLPFLPSRSKAMEIAEVFYDRYGCVYKPIAYEDFMEELIDKIYGPAHMPTLSNIHPHRLALFFGIMAIGHQRSVDFATAGGLNLNAERHYVLACAALSLAPIIAEAMCATVQALFLILCYLGCGSRRGCEESWLLIGIMARVGFRVGLHRDGAQFNLEPAELRRRRLIFWELYKLDAWISFATGRAPAINLADTDTKFPEYVGDSSSMPYTYWKYRHAAACLWPTIKLAGAEATSYEELMALDRKIRTFPVPTHLQATLQGSEVWSWSADSPQAVQQYCIVCDKELTLLFLHRNYLAVALRDENPLAHKFCGSVLAAYRCSTRICFALRDLYRLHPRTVGSMWYFWSSIFSACIVLAAIPIMRPNCTLAQNALTNFKAACRLYGEGAATCPQVSGVEMLRKLERRAETNFMSYWSNPLKYKYVHPPPGTVDELRILGGQQALITHPAPRSHSNSPTPLTSQVSHIRTQHPHSHHPQQHDQSHHAAMQTLMSGTYNDLPASGSSSIPYQPFNNRNGVDETLHFADMDNAFLSSNMPTYEQIMRASTSSFSDGREQTFPHPDHGFHPSGFQGGGSGEYDHSGYSARGRPMDSMDTMPSSSADLHDSQAGSVWDSFVGDLMNGGSPSRYTTGVPYGI